MNSKQEETVKLFRELGWEKVNSENVLDLSFGTSEQKKKVVEGFKSIEWFEYFFEAKTNPLNVNLVALMAFAIRAGIDAQRADELFPSYNDEGGIILEKVIIARGAVFANQMIINCCNDQKRRSPNAPSRFGKIAVALVHDMPLPAPQSPGYIKDWAGCCAPNQSGKGFKNRQITSTELLEKVKERFEEHVQTAVAVGATVSGPMKEMLIWGINQNYISKDKMKSLAFMALNTPIRPLDRQIWIDILDYLHVSDEELCNHLEELLPVLSTGETAVINRLAPVLIDNADDNILVPLLMACFSGASDKTRKTVLEAALKHNRPAEAEKLTEWLAHFCEENDTKTVKLAKKLCEKWSLGITVKQEGINTNEFWQPTPPVWIVPDFSLGEVKHEALTKLASKLMRQTAVVNDVTTEQFLAVANMLAYQDPNEVRLSLRGIRETDYDNLILFYMALWIEGQPSKLLADDEHGGRVLPILPARNHVVINHLGEQPCLLSTPSRDDLSIRSDDLLNRLKTYQNKNIKAQEADLYLAMMRLIPEKLSAKKKEEWEHIHVAVLLQSGKTMNITAGQAVLNWLANPLQEPELKKNNYGSWEITATFKDAPGFPKRLKESIYGGYATYAFPLWEDAALIKLVHKSIEVNHYQGLDLRQVARHSTPFSGDVMLNMLAVQRGILAHDAVEDSHLAVIEAWQRGLLRPVSVDVKKLDWKDDNPEQLVSFSKYLDEIAQQGLLSIVWIVADSLVLASCQASRMYSGTAEMAEIIRRYLPEAKEAINKKIVDSTILDLPGIRMLASKKGKSAAVVAAKAVVEQLPEVSYTQ